MPHSTSSCTPRTSELPSSPSCVSRAECERPCGPCGAWRRAVDSAVGGASHGPSPHPNEEPMRPLNADALASFAETLPTPTYDRRRVRTGIVHIGVGGFHRAHQAAYLDQLMNEGKALDWGIAGVGLFAQDRRMHEVMPAEDCLYTLIIKHPDGSLHPRVVGSIIAYLFAPDDPEAVLE